MSSHGLQMQTLQLHLSHCALHPFSRIICHHPPANARRQWQHNPRPMLSLALLLVQLTNSVNLVSFLARFLYNLNDLIYHTWVGELSLMSASRCYHLVRTWGFHTVDVSPRESSSPERIFLKIRRIILPDRVFGRSTTTMIALGAANGPMDLRTCSTRSFFT